MTRSPHRPSRLATAGRALAMLAVASLALSACGSSDADSSTASGGELVVGTASDLNPAIFYNGVTQTLNANVFETLVDYVDGLEPQARLATDWDVAADGKTVTLTLAEGVTFHSGRAFTSADVAFSLERAADPVNAAPLARTAAVVTKVDSSDPAKAVLTLAHPISNLFDLLANIPMVDSESADGIKDGSSYVGTGPYVFADWTPGTEYVLERNDDYWGEEATLEEVTFKVIPDPQALTSQLRSGQVDVVISASTRDAQSLEKDKNFAVDLVEGSSGTFLGANTKNPKLADVKVRQAIAHAIDRERIAEEIYLGYATPGALPWHSSSPAFDEDLNATYAYDLDKAAELLAESGVDAADLKGLPLAYASENPASGAVAQVIQADLASIGVEIELDPKPMAELNQLGATPGGIEALWLSGHIWSTSSPATLTVTAYAFNSEQNISGYSDAGYKKAATAAWVATGEDAEAGLYTTLAEEFLAGAFINEIAVSDSVRLRDAGVEGIETTHSIFLGLAEAVVAE